MLCDHFAGRLAAVRNLNDRLMLPRIKCLADRFKWGHPFALEEGQKFSMDGGDPFDPRLSRKALRDGRQGAIHVVRNRQRLEEEGFAGQASLALPLLGGAAAEVGEVGGGALVGGDLLVALQERGGERIELRRPLLGRL